MAAFSLRVVAPIGSPIPIAIATETAMFQIVDPPAKIACEVSGWTPGGLSGRRGRRKYRCNSSSIANGLSYKQRTKKVTSQ